MLPKPHLNSGDDKPGRRSRLGEYIPVEHRTRWPITVTPAATEPVHSWITRVSHRYGLTPRQLIQALGVPTEQTPDRSLTQLAKHWDDVAPLLGPGSFTSQKIASAITNRPCRYCPQCLADTGMWSTEWNHNWLLACPTHQIFLHDVCPTCERSQWQSASWLGHTSPPHRCTERVTVTTQSNSEPRKARPWCNTDLTSAPPQPAPPELLTAQHTLLIALDEQETSPTATRKFGPWSQITHHQHAHLFTTLIAYADSHSPGIAGQTTTLLTAWKAYQELDSPTGTGPHVRNLFADIANTGLLGPPRTARTTDLGPVLIASLLKTQELLSANKQLAFRTARTWPTHPPDWSTSSPRSQSDLSQAFLPEHSTVPLTPPPEWIPQTLWPGFGTDHSTPGARAVESLLLLHLGRAARWSHLALELGLPATLQHQARAHIRRLTSTSWHDQLVHLENQFAQLLSSPPPINYRIRRVIAADPDELTQALRKTTGSAPSPVLLRHFWETLTGGDIALAPSPLGISEDSPKYTMFVNQRSDFHHEYKQVFTHALNYLQNEHGMPSDEPLIWSPPP